MSAGYCLELAPSLLDVARPNVCGDSSRVGLVGLGEASSGTGVNGDAATDPIYGADAGVCGSVVTGGSVSRMVSA